MSGAGITYDLTAIEAVSARIDQLAQIDRTRLLETVGAAVESSARRRISEEKQSPAGIRWPAWSQRHADTRHAGHSLLEGEGHLLDSLMHVVSGDQVEVGSNLIYFATHQFGDADRNIPQREVLGLSAADSAEVDQMVEDFIREVLP